MDRNQKYFTVEEYVCEEKIGITTLPIKEETIFIPTDEDLDVHYKNSIADRFLKATETYPTSLLGAISVKMGFFHRFSETEKPGELLLNYLHSNINNIASEIIFEKFKTRKQKLSIRANQTTLKSDSILYFDQVPLLLCEYKPIFDQNLTLSTTSDVEKSSTIMNNEILSEDNLLNLDTNILQNCKPIILIANQYNFRLYQFEKLATETGQGTLQSQYSVLRPIQLFQYSTSVSFNLYDATHVYAAVKVIVECASITINWLSGITDPPQAKAPVQIEASPRKQPQSQQLGLVFAHFDKFTLSNKDTYIHKFKCNDAVHVYRGTVTNNIIKMIDKNELKNYELAARISKRTIPAEIFSLEKVPSHHKRNYKYLLCMPEGERVDVREIPLDTACTQLLEGIVDYHANNMIHMDVKPSNVVVVQDNLYFIDFGVSQIFHHEEAGIAYDKNNVPLQQRKGTRLFWAPEVFSGDNYGTKADCYGCGVTILCFVERFSQIATFDFRKSTKIILEDVIKFFKTIEDKPSLFKYMVIVIALIRADPKERISAKTALEMITNPITCKIKYTTEEIKLLRKMNIAPKSIEYEGSLDEILSQAPKHILEKANSTEGLEEVLTDPNTIELTNEYKNEKPITKGEPSARSERMGEVQSRKRNREVFEKNTSKKASQTNFKRHKIQKDNPHHGSKH